MGLPNKVRFGLAADDEAEETRILHLTQSETVEPHYRMELNGRVQENDLVQMAQLLSLEGIEPILTARSRIYRGEKEYKYPLAFLRDDIYTEALTEFMAVSVPPEETENLLAHDDCTPMC